MAPIKSLTLLALVSSSQAFAPISPQSTASATRLFSEDGGNGVERGVSIDQDGKSNVWAIEPREQLDTKSSEEKTTSALVAGGGIAAFVVAAGVILTNLPDPNQF